MTAGPASMTLLKRQKAPPLPRLAAIDILISRIFIERSSARIGKDERNSFLNTLRGLFF
jgi:hypothetical protein